MIGIKVLVPTTIMLLLIIRNRLIRNIKWCVTILKKRGTIGVYLGLVIFVTLLALMDVWTEEFYTIRWLISSESKERIIASLIVRKNLLYTIIGTILGGIICSFKGIHTYNSKDDWNQELAISYYLGPLITVVLGIAFYCLVSESFIAIKVGEKDLLSTTTSSLGVGFLVGLSWYNFVLRATKLSGKTSGALFEQEYNKNKCSLKHSD